MFMEDRTRQDTRQTILAHLATTSDDAPVVSAVID